MAKARGISSRLSRKPGSFPPQLPSTGLMPWKCNDLLSLPVVKCNVVLNLEDTNSGLSARRTGWGNSAIALKAVAK